MLDRVVLPDLFADPSKLDALPWRPFREGISIVQLYGGAEGEPAAALLKYEPGARVPLHEHPGYEHILVLSGAQSDASGLYPAGTLIVNPPGSCHRVVSEHGCVVLAIWASPVRFLPE